MRKIILIAGLFLLCPSHSWAGSLEELLVQKGVITKGEAAKASTGEMAKVYWNDGTRLDFPDSGFTAKINTFMQTRYTFTDNDADSGAKDTSSFDVNRARLIVSGSALHNEFSYKLEGDFVGGATAGAKTTTLKDAYLAWNACDWLSLKMGQYKTGISRQFVNSDAKIQFADRSIASDYFNLGRQAGLSANGTFADGKLMVGGGIFNGESDGEGTNKSGIDNKHTLIANARYNAMGEMDSYEEGDVNWTDDAALSLGAAYAWSDANNDVGAGLEKTEKNTISADVNFKSQGWSVHGEYFWSDFNPDMSASTSPTGWYAQAGYFFMPKKAELALRYSMLDCDDGAAMGSCSGNDSIDEASASVNYYWWQNHLKAQLGYVYMNMNPDASGASDVSTDKWVFQLSSYF